MAKDGILKTSWEKTGEYALTWNRSFNTPLLTLPGIQIDLYLTFLFSSIPTHILCLYVSVCHSC